MAYHAVKNVVPRDGFSLLLTFDNGETRLYDAAAVLSFGRFRELRDPALFRKVHVSFDTVEWDNGLDLDPELLYRNSKVVRD